MENRNKYLIYLILIALVDMLIPIPIMSIILIYVLMQKPPWFKNLVAEIYKS
jgi:hypothetical protein